MVLISKIFKFKPYPVASTDDTKPITAGRGMINSYRISSLIKGFPEQLPKSSELTWQEVKTNEEGVLMISKYVQKSERNQSAER